MFAPSDYTFELPPELIAQEPAAQRDASRLLHVRGDGGCDDLAFPAIAELLPADAVLVVNDTRVIPARVLGHKATGGNVELLLLEPDATPAPPGHEAWRALARARRPLRAGQIVHVGQEANKNAIEILSERADDGSIAVAIPAQGDAGALAFLDRVGHVPLPRYIRRDADVPADRDRYQTMFARVPGAVAAPTAGLHMTPAVADALRARGVAIASVTLHVGYGTFEPIREADIRAHHMHRERYVIPDATAALVASGRPIVALGTTALRALEASRGTAGSGSTELFIYPGSNHDFVVDHLITNFHLPESTLLMLVCAFAGPDGRDRVLAAYRHAVAQRYRFFSYGDAMLVHRGGRTGVLG
ncbi:MAG TPA: tRNA preQ1(34) S-adenosylmethionine ribosyltransferase-isomerase QueA [Kofleriaceae bacterium]